MRIGILTSSLLIAVMIALCGAQEPQKKPSPKTPRTGNSGEAAGANFVLECKKLPFDEIATKPDPFVQCGNCGVVSAKAKPEEVDPKTAQSHAKNNFCADISKVTPVNVADLRNLQKQTTNLVTTNLSDRTQLHGTLNGKPIQEGDVVRLVAWVKDAHLSDCSGGEEVNCKFSGAKHNDIHIVLVDPTSGGPDQDECSSVTAEMSPHFRPEAWSQLDKKIPTNNIIRVTGPLFFDNAHTPCAGLTTQKTDRAPLRSSLWEIHPVYQFEVCKSTDAKECDVSNDSVWEPYHLWVMDAANHTHPTQFKEECKEPGSQAPGNVAPHCSLKR